MKNPDDYLSIEQVGCSMGAKIKVSGIVSEVRNQGGLFFVDIRERNNLIQALVIPDNVSAYGMAKGVQKGYLVEIKGSVKECPASIQVFSNFRIIEIEVEKISIISARSEKENKSKSRKILSRMKNLAGKNKKV